MQFIGKYFWVIDGRFIVEQRNDDSLWALQGDGGWKPYPETTDYLGENGRMVTRLEVRKILAQVDMQRHES